MAKMAQKFACTGKVSSPTILCIGNAVVDAVFEGPLNQLVQQFGQYIQTSSGTELESLVEAAHSNAAVKNEIIDYVWNHPSSKRVVGGSALNTARVASWFTQGSLSHGVAFLGCVGNDDRAGMVLKACQDAMVVPLIRNASSSHGDSSQATGSCAVIVEHESRERTILCNRGAAEWLDPSFLHEVLKVSERDLLRNSEFFYATSFHLTTPSRYQVVANLAQNCQGSVTLSCESMQSKEASLEDVLVGKEGNQWQHGRDHHQASTASSCKFALNLSSSQLITKLKHEVETLLPFCTILFGNAEEALAWGTVQGWSCTSDVKGTVKKIALTLHNNVSSETERVRGSRWVIVTDGPHGCYFAQCTESGEVTTFSVPIAKEFQFGNAAVLIQDTNGAGDAFVAGVLAMLAKTPGQLGIPDVQAAIYHGQYCAYEILQQTGCELPKHAPASLMKR